jgi:hypothetical protein
MATISAGSPSIEQSERLFFLAMAVAIAGTVIFAFGMWHSIGRSTFASPWWVHVHAVSFMTWIALYLTQNVLAFRNQIALHRQLGRIGAGFAAWMVIVGLLITANTLAQHRAPPFFTPAFFLALDWTNIAVFAGLVLAGIANRRRTDWHRRLMLCATVSLIAPAWGRILIWQNAMTLWSLVAALLAYIIVAMIADRLIRGRVHPAYFWGFGAIVAWGVSIELLTRVAPFAALAERIAA